jgi:3'-phosphoadenosine 5'-phosphosulfate sulfotransferase (PAPS reductase)/FAD synthetase
MTEMISFGCGVNSVAMAIMLIDKGWKGPIVFADTGGEHPETYCYLRYFEREYLIPRGLSVTQISPKTNPELYNDKKVKLGLTLEEYCRSYQMIPLMRVRWCSVMYKKDPLQCWGKQNNIETQLIGIAYDEPKRIRDGNYPLVEAGIDRKDCIGIITKAGLEVPRKSGCFFCPSQPVRGWRELYFNDPGLYERAAMLEDAANERVGGGVSLTWGGPTLREKAIIRNWEGQSRMDFEELKPCICAI